MRLSYQIVDMGGFYGTIFFHDDRLVSHRRLANHLSILMNLESINSTIRVLHGLVLFEQLDKYIQSFTKEDQNLSFNWKSNLVTHMNTYNKFCKELESSKKSIQHQIKLYEFKKGVEAYTTIGLDDKLLDEFDTQLRQTDSNYIGYAILDMGINHNYMLFIL